MLVCVTIRIIFITNTSTKQTVITIDKSWQRVGYFTSKKILVID